MVMSNEQALSLIAAAQEAASNGGEVPAELRCQYPSKRCDHVRTTKRGGGLHRLCSFHRQRANKNQWLVDQRRRMRRERDGSLMRRSSNAASPTSSNSGSPASSPKKESSLAPTIMSALDVLDADVVWAPLANNDLDILQTLLFEDVDELSELSDLSDGFLTDASMDWAL